MKKIFLSLVFVFSFVAVTPTSAKNTSSYNKEHLLEFNINAENVTVTRVSLFSNNIEKSDIKLIPRNTLIDIDCKKLSQAVGDFLEKNSELSQWKIDIVVEAVNQVCKAVT